MTPPCHPFSLPATLTPCYLAGRDELLSPGCPQDDPVPTIHPPSAGGDSLLPAAFLCWVFMAFLGMACKAQPAAPGGVREHRVDPKIWHLEGCDIVRCTLLLCSV